MGPRGFGGLCLALLCSGAALGFQEEESGNGNGNGNSTEETPQGTREPPEPPGHPSAATGDGDTVTTWPRVTTSAPGSLGDPAVTPAGNQSHDVPPTRRTRHHLSPPEGGAITLEDLLLSWRTWHPLRGPATTLECPKVSPPVTSVPTGTSSGVPARYWSPVIFVVLALLVLFVTYQRNKDRGIRGGATSGSDSSDLGALVRPHAHDPIPKIPELAETPLDQPGPPQPPPDSPPGGS